MFKKFVAKEEISGTSQLKSSVQRGIRTKVLELYPAIEHYIDQILPKKESIVLIKCKEHIEVLSVKSELVFFRQRDGPWIPTLRLLHKYPFLLTIEQVDKGAIRFVLSGANIMCPGLTSPGAKMNNAEKDTIVAIMAEGKEHAVSIGVTKMSTQEMLIGTSTWIWRQNYKYKYLTTNLLGTEKNKGIGVDNIHYLNDGMWVMNQLDK
ncbi:malignant T-cell-amplified sequence 1 homolog isoform X1 [Hydractinia symbiolongicarpus]|uniref:malignant T-cell-amplified sequence 1 homolog isoform X1 n=1 Tax=Hydractinia symbiolongicarpus TaxID=13093 RepID=UPI00254A50B4|nr:malignant T-cell-amplified sequence 1 homolog isoform X1 [Hydractinia symbiolongicarpus]